MSKAINYLSSSVHASAASQLGGASFHLLKGGGGLHLRFKVRLFSCFIRSNSATSAVFSG